jgi:hypothetical protein
VSPRCAIRGAEDDAEVHNVPVDGVLFFATIAGVYGVIVLFVSARLTGTRPCHPDGGLVSAVLHAAPARVRRSIIAIPMTTGVTFAALVRG